MASCGEVLARLLEKNYGVGTVFGIPGVHTLELYRGLAGTQIRHITPRHEQGAGFMADGFARATGQPGVCFIITGPGMTNMATPMGQAMQDSIPMLVISSVSDSRHLGMGEGRLHELPSQRDVARGLSAFSHTLLRADELPKVLSRAFAVFRSARPAPVHIEIPLDVLASSGDSIDQTPWPIPSAPGPAPAAIAEAASLLSAAERPLIAIGGGAITAAEEVMALAERLQAPVINTVNAKGVLPYSHPLAVGGSGSCAPVRKELLEADVVLAIGTELAETDYDFFGVGGVRLDGTLIRIDIDASQLTRNARPDLAIVSDAREALVALNTALAGVQQSSGSNGLVRAAELRASLRSTADRNFEAFFAAIDEALPEAIIAGDSTQPTYYAWLHYEKERPRQYFHSASGYGTLGYAIPAAIGAKLGQPDSAVIGLIGDGAAQFTIGELASAVEAEVSVIFLVWNNAGYGEIRQFFADEGVEPIGVDIHTPDFDQLGKGFGCAVARPQDLPALKRALLAARDHNGPTLIEVMEADFVDGDPTW